MSLRRGFGEGRLADALLVKWLADPEAGSSWERLAGVLEGVSAGQVEAFEAQQRRPPRTAVALWWLSLGLSEAAAAEQMGVTASTFKTHVRNARAELGVTGGTLPQLVAEAIRRGLIP